MLDKLKQSAGIWRPYLRNQNVRWGEFDLNDVFSMPFLEHEDERFGVQEGDLIVCEGGEPGRAAIWDGRVPGMKYQKALHRVRPSNGVIPEWLLYHLIQDAGSERMTGLFTGTTIKHLTRESLCRYQVLVPPHNEQRRIVAKLDELFARSRAAREALDAIPPLLERFRQSVLAAAFRGDLTAEWRQRNPGLEPASVQLEQIISRRAASWQTAGARGAYKNPNTVPAGSLPTIPPGWTWATVDALLTGPLLNGKSVQGSQKPPGVAVLRLNSMGDEGLDYESVKYVQLPEAVVERLKVQTGDFFVSRGNGSLELMGRGVLAAEPPRPTIFPDLMIRMRFDTAYREWISLIWGSPVIRRTLEASAKTTAGIWKISQGDLTGIAVPLPPVKEAEEAVCLAKGLLNGESVLFQHLVASCRAARQLDSAILSQAFSGQLVPQDPSDEPASVLLDRIRAERAAQPKPARSRKTRSEP